MANRVVKYTGSYRYKTAQIPFDMWAHIGESRAPDTLLFLGAGQIKNIARWVAELAPSGTIVIAGLPHWHADASGEGLQDFTTGYVQSAYEQVLSIFQLPHIHVIAESQVCPAAIYLGLQNPKTVRNILLLLPMGLTTHYLGETSSQKFHEFTKRSKKSLQQFRSTPMYDIRNIYIGYILSGIILRGYKDGSFANHFTIGVSYDARQELKLLWNVQKGKSASLTLFLGANDKIFPSNEVRKSLKELHLNEISVKVFPKATHSSFALRGNKHMLTEAVETVRK